MEKKTVQGIFFGLMNIHTSLEAEMSRAWILSLEWRSLTIGYLILEPLLVWRAEGRTVKDEGPGRGGGGSSGGTV